MKNNVNNLIKWLSPGIGVKRWMVLSFFGVVLLVMGTAFLRVDQYWAIQVLDAMVVISGIIILILGWIVC